jgi:hypothetical protein
MAAPQQKDVFKAVRPVAQANSSILGVVETLVRQAQETQDESAKQNLLNAAKELIKASDIITDALEEVAKS